MRPLISCICVTRGRPKWLQLAIEYFHAQTFKDAELRIIVDHDDKSYNDGADDCGLCNLEGNGVWVRRVQKPETLGDKRNIACEEARGEIIAVWDDDDYHGPTRLRDQVDTIQKSGVEVTAYNRMKFTDGLNWWVYDGILQNVGIGGSLMFTKHHWTRNKFPSMDVSEDNRLIYNAWKMREFIATSACADKVHPGVEIADRMYATIHPANTSTRDTISVGSYSQVGQNYVPGRVIDAFRAVGAAFDAYQAPAAPGAKCV